MFRPLRCLHLFDCAAAWEGPPRERPSDVVWPAGIQSSRSPGKRPSSCSDQAGVQVNRHSFPQIAAETSSVIQSQKVMKNAEKLLKSSASLRIANGVKSRPQSGIQNQGPATAQPLAALPACGGGVLPLVNGLDLEKMHTGRRRMSSFCWGQKKTWSQSELCDHVEGAVKIDIFEIQKTPGEPLNRPSGRRRECAANSEPPRRRIIAQGRLCRPRAFKYRRVERVNRTAEPKTKGTTSVVPFVLVEVGGVEPPSESTLTGLSPGADGYCGSLSPRSPPGRQAVTPSGQVRVIMRGRGNSYPPHGRHINDAFPGLWPLRFRRPPLIRQQ